MPSEQPKDDEISEHEPDLFEQHCTRVLEALKGVPSNLQIPVLEEVIHSLKTANAV
jgi:hypothetical protein